MTWFHKINTKQKLTIFRASCKDKFFLLPLCPLKSNVTPRTDDRTLQVASLPLGNNAGATPLPVLPRHQHPAAGSEERLCTWTLLHVCHWPRASAADPQCSPVRRPHYTSCTLGAKCRCPSALTPTSRFWRPMSASALKPFQAQGLLAHQGFVRRHTGNPWGLYKLCCCTLLMMLSDILLELDWRRTCHVAF